MPFGCNKYKHLLILIAIAGHQTETIESSLVPGLAAMCGSSSTVFARSKALLGSINDVERSRVNDLQNPDPDHALAPHWRAASMQIIVQNISKQTTVD